MGISKAILLTVFLSFVEIGVLFLSYIIFGPKNTPEISVHLHGIAVITARLIAYALVFIFFWKKDVGKDFLGFSNLKIAVIPLLFLLIIASEFVFRPFLDFERILKVFQGINLPSYNYTFGGFTAKQLYSTTAALLISPVIEELFFRKFLLGELLKKYSLPVALGVSSLLFSAIHWETPTNLLPSFIFGVISGFIFFKTKKIGYSIILHFFSNLLSFAFAVKGAAYYDLLYWLNFGYLYWFLFFAGLFTIFAVVKLISRIYTRIEIDQNNL